VLKETTLSKLVVQWLLNNFLVFVLVLTRIASATMVAPMFSSVSIPPRLKVAFATFVSMAVFPLVRHVAVAVPTDLLGMTIGVLGEMLVGLTLGFGAAVLFAGVEIGGVIISRNMGTALANVFNPMFESSVPLMGQFYSFFALVVFMGTNGHHRLLEILIGTFRQVPLLGFRLTPNVAMHMVTMLGESFVLAFKLAAPVLVSLLLVTVSLGIVARTVPQMNVLIVGFPLKVCLGLVVSVVTLGAMALLLQGTFQWMLASLGGLLKSTIP